MARKPKADPPPADDTIGDDDPLAGLANRIDEEQANPDTPPEQPEATVEPTEPPEGDTETPPGDGAGDDEPPELTPFERLVADIEDPAEQRAAIERAARMLPEEESAQLSWNTERSQQQAAESTQAQANRAKLAKDNAEATRVRSGETVAAEIRKMRQAALEVARQYDPQAELDDVNVDAIDGAMEDYARARSALDNYHNTNTFNLALYNRIAKHGGPLTEDQKKRLETAMPEGFDAVVNTYLDMVEEAIGTARDAEYEKRREKDHETWRRSELAALRAEVMRELEVEPETAAGRTISGGLTREAIEKMSDEERERRGPEIAAWITEGMRAGG